LSAKASEKIVKKIQEQAETLVKLTEHKFKIKLDYSEEALALADDLITVFFKIHREHYIKATVLIGSYLGETIIRNLGGKWMKDLSIAKVGKLKGTAYPMGRARKRLANGTDDSFVYYYKNLKLTTTRNSSFAEDKKKLDKYGDILLENGWDLVLLIRMLDEMEPRYVREEAAELLGRLANESVADSLVKAAKNPDTTYYASIALQGLPVKDAYEPLLDNLRRAVEPAVKQQLLMALGNLKIPESIDVIIKYLDDEDEIVGHYASLALGEIGGQDAVDKLLGIMAGLRPGRREHAITALELIGDCRAVPALIEALFSREDEIREAAARALQYIPDDRAFKPLAYCLKDQEQQDQGFCRIRPGKYRK
jgi:hypothetical protein